MSRIRTIKPLAMQTWSETGVSKATYSLYCIAEEGCEWTGPCKIGIATNMQKRMSSLQGGNWRRLRLVWQMLVASRDDALRAEDHCLLSFRPNAYDTSNQQDRLASEWVHAPPQYVLKAAVAYLNADDLRVHLDIAS